MGEEGPRGGKERGKRIVFIAKRYPLLVIPLKSFPNHSLQKIRSYFVPNGLGLDRKLAEKVLP